MFLVLEETQIFVPGDERSRTHPGHGYSASYEDSTRVHRFTDRTSLLLFLQRSTTDASSSYEVFEATPMKVATTVSISVE